MDIVTRLKQFMDYCGLPSSQFADQAQIPRPTLSQILNGRNKKISNELISKLHEAFPNLNVLWLMFGDGDMVFGENIEFSEPHLDQNLFNQEEQVPEFQTNEDSIDSIKHIPNSTTSTQSPINNASIHAQPTIQPSNASAKTATETIVPVTMTADKSKKIASIMVFYTDNSFERYIPAETTIN